MTKSLAKKASARNARRHARKRLAEELVQVEATIRACGRWSPEHSPCCAAIVHAAVREARSRKYWRRKMYVSTQYGRFPFYVTNLGRVGVEIDGLKISTSYGELW